MTAILLTLIISKHMIFHMNVNNVIVLQIHVRTIWMTHRQAIFSSEWKSYNFADRY